MAGGLATLLLVACNQPQDGVLRFGLSANVVTLDPRYATDANSTRVIRLIYRQLVDFDDHYQAVPSLATWQRLAPQHYQFSLGTDGREFSDGSHLTAADVKATYDSILAEDTGSPHRASLEVIDAIRVLDDDRLDFLLKHPDPLFPGRLVVGIAPAARLGDGGGLGRAPVGSGGFVVRAWPSDDRLVLERRRDGEQVEFVRVQDPLVRVLKLVRGEIDMFQSNVTPELVDWLGRRSGIHLEFGRGSNFTYLGFNLEDPLTGQLDFRRAVAHALDRESILRYVMRGSARLANGLLTGDHWAGNPALMPYAYDPAAARRLLAGLGYSGAAPAVVYKTSSDPLRVRLASIIQHQLRQVGIDVQIRSFDWGTFYGDVKAGRFQMFSLSWVGVKMPDIFRYVFASDSVPPAGANRGRYRNPELDRLLDRAESLPDLAQQAAAYREIQTILHHDLPYVPLWYENQVFVSRSDIRGYRVAADGNYDGLLTVERRGG